LSGGHEGPRHCQWNGSEPANGRFYCGYHTWTAGLRGNWQWCYTEGYKGSASLADELELKLPFYEDPWYVNYVLPTPQGNIPSLGWEGRREGIDDYRYLQTLRQAAAAAEKSPNAELRQQADEARQFLLEVEQRTRLPPQRQPATNAGQNYGFAMHPGLQAHDYDAIRERAAEFIVRLGGGRLR
jgi:hypothetical protein